MPRRGLLPVALAVAAAWAIPIWASKTIATEAASVIQILEQRRCERCNLDDADLVHADLRDAQLQGAKLQRANLSGARLSGADLRQANLSFASLAGASLQGADLRGAVLIGTDLRNADLTGAVIEAGGLSRSHWQHAKGISLSAHSYAELHNAGIQAAQEGRHPDAEAWFNHAIKRMPEAAVSWVGRGLSRAEQGELQLAAQDLTYAAQLYSLMGDTSQAEALTQAANLMTQSPPRPKGGNGAGSHLVGAAITAFQILAPLAAKTMLPIPF
jgi:uncharacterized protein YjbI with pentapeptide repeats